MLCGLSQLISRPASASASRSFGTASASRFRCCSPPGQPSPRTRTLDLRRRHSRSFPVSPRVEPGRGERMSEEGRSVRLTIPAKPEYITLGRLTLTALAGVRPVSDETLHDLKLALTEACTNSVQHAYQDGREGTVEILYELEPDRLAVEVADQGAGFELLEQEAEADPEAELSESGLGIAIIRAIADEVEIGPRDSGGPRAPLVQLLPPPVSPASGGRQGLPPSPH